MAVTYKLPDSLLSSLAFEFDDQRFLFAITNTFSFRAPGDHQIFPYCVSGNLFATRSTERPSVGHLAFGGLLLGEAELLRTALFDKIGLIQTSGVRFRMTDLGTGVPLMHKRLMDFRLGDISLTTSLFGNTTIVGGQFGFTFRDMSSLPI